MRAHAWTNDYFNMYLSKSPMSDVADSRKQQCCIQDMHTSYKTVSSDQVETRGFPGLLKWDGKSTWTFKKMYLSLVTNATGCDVRSKLSWWRKSYEVARDWSPVYHRVSTAQQTTVCTHGHTCRPLRGSLRTWREPMKTCSERVVHTEPSCCEVTALSTAPSRQLNEIATNGIVLMEQWMGEMGHSWFDRWVRDERTINHKTNPSCRFPLAVSRSNWERLLGAHWADGQLY